MKVHYKGGNINYTVAGSGRAVVLLHGFLESSVMWEAYADLLQKNKKVICIDLPGHGQSDCYGYVHSMEWMAECVKAVLDELNVRKCVMIGHSMGGYVSLAFADQYPDYLRGICLFFSTTREDTLVKKAGRDQAIRLVKENHKSFIRKAIPQLFRHKNRSAFRTEINALKKEALKTPKQGIIAALEGMKNRVDREIIIRFCPYEVLFICGKHDPVIPVKSVEEQYQSSEKSDIFIVKEAGHMGHIEEGEECLSALKKFINKCYS